MSIPFFPVYTEWSFLANAILQRLLKLKKQINKKRFRIRIEICQISGQSIIGLGWSNGTHSSSTASLGPCSRLDCTYRGTQLKPCCCLSLRAEDKSFNFLPWHLQAISQNNPMSRTNSSLPFTVTAATVAVKGRMWGRGRAGKGHAYIRLLGHPWQFIQQISPPRPPMCSVVTQWGAKCPMVPDQVNAYRILEISECH